MRRSVETGLIQHHQNLKYLIDNLGISSFEIHMQESNVITLNEAFKNILILLFIGTVISLMVFFEELIRLFYLVRKLRKCKEGNPKLKGNWVNVPQRYFILNRNFIQS